MRRRWLTIEVLFVAAIAGCDWGAPPPVPVTLPAAPPAAPMAGEVADILRDVLDLPAPPSTMATLGALGGDELDLAELVTELESRGYRITLADLIGRDEGGARDWERLTIENLAAIVNRQAGGESTSPRDPPEQGRVAGAGIVKPEEEGVGLQTWWVALNDNFAERIDLDQTGSMPQLGCHVVLDGEQAHWFRQAAQGDRRSNTQRHAPVTIAAGTRHNIPLGVDYILSGVDDLEGIAVEAKLLDEARGAEIRVTPGKFHNGAKAWNPIAAPVPAGSSLMVNTREMVLSSAPPRVSFWERMWNGGVPPSPTMERMHVYLLIRPRLLPQSAPVAPGR
jgi:hypothetical protein